ncbi:MAG TPA: ATP synthase F0 subunit B [Acidobacteriota bacterium]|nr:ATP synthase F0 subunit B [Acidobacteriota bacterium]
MKLEKTGLAATLLLALLFTGASPAEEGHAAASSDLPAKAVNFLILFGGLGYFLYKPVRALLEKRSADVRHSLDEAAASRSEAEGKRAAARGRLDGVAAEIERMKAEAASRGRLEKDRIARAAEEEGARLREFTAREIDLQTRTAVRELKAFVAETATSIARERIRGALGPGDQGALVDKSIERLSRLNEKSHSG